MRSTSCGAALATLNPKQPPNDSATTITCTQNWIRHASSDQQRLHICLQQELARCVLSTGGLHAMHLAFAEVCDLLQL